MPTVIATIRVKEDKVEEAKRFFKQLAADTLAKEKGTLVYQPYQRKDQPTTFVFYEKYASDADLAIHSKNLGAVGPQFAAVMDGRPEIVFLDEV